MSSDHVPQFKTENNFLDRVALILLCSVVVSLGLVQTRTSVGPIEMGLTEVLFLLLLPVWALKLGSLRLTQHQKWIWITAVVYLLTGMLSAFFSASPLTSLRHMLGETYLALLFIVSSTLINDFGKVKLVTTAWLVGAFIASFTSLATIAVFYIDRQNTLLEFLTYHYGSVPVGDFPRVTATFASASLYFNYLSVSIILLLCRWKVRWTSRPLYQVGLVATVISSIFTFSIGLGSFFLIAAWWVFICDPIRPHVKRRIGQFLVLASFLWLVLALVALHPYPESPFTISVPGVDFQIFPSARYLVWNDTIGTIASHFLFGIGPGTPVCNVLFTNTDGTLSLLTDAHNTFLNVLGERGVVGAVAITTTIALILRRSPIPGSKEISYSHALISNGLKFALVIGFVYQGLVGSFEDAKHLWILMGLTVAADELYSKDDNTNSSQNPG